MRMTIKHYYDFAGGNSDVLNLDNASSWDELRLASAGTEFYAIPKDRRLWAEKSEKDFIKAKAKDIVAVCRGRFKRINSFGVGAGFLEYQIKKHAPDVFIQCSDYSPRSIDQLKRNFPEANEVIVFDVFKDVWQNAGDDCLYLFYGVDTAFNDVEWREIFKKISGAGIKNILYVPSEFLTVKKFLSQKAKGFLREFRIKKMSFAGYLRTFDQFLDLFKGSYKVVSLERIGDRKGFLLERIS